MADSDDIEVAETTQTPEDRAQTCATVCTSLLAGLVNEGSTLTDDAASVLADLVKQVTPAKARKVTKG